MTREVTESILNKENGLQNMVSISDGCKDPRYRILVVSNKFQTGFDEHLLQAMFVDKKLSGVQCVQTLSRLNRTCSGKTETFVLDFANDTAELVEAFQPFYTSTELAGETDPNKLYDLETRIRGYNLFTKYMVDEFCRLFYNERESDEMLQPVLNRVVEKWSGIGEYRLQLEDVSGVLEPMAAMGGGGLAEGVPRLPFGDRTQAE